MKKQTKASMAWQRTKCIYNNPINIDAMTRASSDNKYY